MDPIIAPVIHVLLLGGSPVTGVLFGGFVVEVGLGANLGLADELKLVDEAEDVAREGLLTVEGSTVLSVK